MRIQDWILGTEQGEAIFGLPLAVATYTRYNVGTAREGLFPAASEQIIILLRIIDYGSRDCRLSIYPEWYIEKYTATPGYTPGVTTKVYGGLGYIRTLITSMYLVLRVQPDQLLGLHCFAIRLPDLLL